MLADPLYHDPLDSFTDREQLIQLVEHCLRAAQAGRLRLLAVTGNSGTGKTFLISYLTTHVCPALSWPSGQLSFAQSRLDFRAIVAGLEAALKGCVPRASLNQYRAKRDDYHLRFDDYRAKLDAQLSAQLRVEVRIVVQRLVRSRAAPFPGLSFF